MQTQRFITAIKSVIEKKNTQNLIIFHSANKTDNYNRVGKKRKTEMSKKKRKRKEEIRKKLQNKSKQKNNKMFFLSHCCQCPFRRWESQFTSPPQVALQHCVGLWTCYEGSLDSNLVLLPCLLASNVHSCQNWHIFLCGSSQCPFIYSVDTGSAQLIVWI